MATAVKTPKKRRLEAPLKTFTIRQLTKTDKNAVLAAKASKLLGYKLFGKHLRQPEVLGKALMELDIHPLDRTSVELYKRKKLIATRKQYHGNSEYNYRVDWHMVELKNYGSPIPEFVLNKAVQIAEKTPKAKFMIEDIQVRQETRTRNLDPFLVVTLGGEEYYVEVWDEPKFETSLIDK